MLTDPEPNRNIDELNDDEVYAAIRYLEPVPGIVSKQSDDAALPAQNDDNGVVMCICLYVALLGCLAFFWLYWR
jgi:hypothetical protein